MTAEGAELVFITIPIMGHLPSAVAAAQKLAARWPDRIAVTVLTMTFPFPDSNVDSFIQSLKKKPQGTNPISFHQLPELERPPELAHSNSMRVYVEAYRPILRRTVLANQQNPSRRILAGLVLDMSCTSMIDVADELGVPSYIFYPSGAAFLRLTLHFSYYGVPDVHTADQVTSNSDENCPVRLQLEGFSNPVPAKVWPEIIVSKESSWAKKILEGGRRFRETKGILVNTFTELESHLISSFTSLDEHEDAPVPKVYPIGPIINLNKDSANRTDQKNLIISWLDSQPPRSVVFLCFGSRGAFDQNQVREIAVGLERTGHRFLWSLRRKEGQSRNGHFMFNSPEEYLYEDIRDVLPYGFLARTAGVGKVIGWAPQVTVLRHRAVGAFVSHCGWNSTLESLWFGVPLVTWPMYAEQQLNAFMLLKELGLAVEMRMDYKRTFHGEANFLVEAEVVEKAITKVMDEKEEGQILREKVKNISVMAHKCGEIGGSSYRSMGCFIEDVFKNLP